MMTRSIALISFLSAIFSQSFARADCTLHVNIEGVTGGHNHTTIDECVSAIREVTSGWPEDQILESATTLCNLSHRQWEAMRTLNDRLDALMCDHQGDTNHGVDQDAVLIATLIASETVPDCIRTHMHAYVCHNVACLYQEEVVRMDCYNWAMLHPSLIYPWETSRLGREGGGQD